MSGSSYNYLYTRYFPTEVLPYPDEFKRMAATLEREFPDSKAAKDMMVLSDLVDTVHKQGEAIFERLITVMKAVEWWESSDWSREHLAEDVQKYELKNNHYNGMSWVP